MFYIVIELETEIFLPFKAIQQAGLQKVVRLLTVRASSI